MLYDMHEIAAIFQGFLIKLWPFVIKSGQFEVVANPTISMHSDLWFFCYVLIVLVIVPCLYINIIGESIWISNDHNNDNLIPGNHASAHLQNAKMPLGSLKRTMSTASFWLLQFVYKDTMQTILLRSYPC